MGYGKGDRIGIWSTNNVEWLVLQLATARIGAILVNINPAYRRREVAFALQRSRVQCLFTIPSFKTSDYVGMLTDLMPALEAPAPVGLRAHDFPRLRRVVVYDPDDALNTERTMPGFTTWQEVIAVADGVSREQLDTATAALEIDDPINIQYTSGTTGFPKAVVLTHHNILNNGFFCARSMRLTQEDRLCVPVPFYHCFGMVVSNLGCLTVGACIVIPSVADRHHGGCALPPGPHEASDEGDAHRGYPDRLRTDRSGAGDPPHGSR
jgi:fatty-acyl-CoA synthase